MITFARSTNDVQYYESDNYNIAVNEYNGKIESVIITTKRYLFPDILCDINDNTCDLSIKYDTIIINEKRFTRFGENYNTALLFIESELKPFIENKMKGCV